MIRVFEVVVALIIVFVLAVIVGAVLPAHGHIERSVVVSSPLRQVYDSVNTFRRFPEWAALRRLDPQTKMQFEGPESGKGAKVDWTSDAPKVGNGSLEIVQSDPDSKIVMSVDNNWAGANKTYTITMTPSENGKTVNVNWSYDVDYDWNLLWRYSGLYIHGDPANEIQGDVGNIAAMLATFPNVDYKDQEISITEVAAKPVFLVRTKAKRSLEDVADATDAAMKQIEAAMKKAGVNAAGPRMTITTNWGEDDYAFSVAVPVDATEITLDKQQYTIQTPQPPASATSDEGDDDTGDEPKALKPGDTDPHGMLVIDDKVRAALWYQGKALVTDYTGSPAALPLLRLMEKAYAETHGYPYAEMDEGRFWDEVVSQPDAAEDQQEFKVYLPIQVQ